MKITDRKSRLATIFVGICVAIACAYLLSDSSKRKIEEQLVAMQGMHVDLTFSEAMAIYNGIDSAYTPQTCPKLVVYVDSLSCTGCFINKMIVYHDICDSLSVRNVSLVIILHPAQNKLHDVSTRLSFGKYPFWCIIDQKGEFTKRNPGIPENQLFHTFLLDKGDKVMLVGDPTRNSYVKTLLYDVLSDGHKYETNSN